MHALIVIAVSYALGCLSTAYYLFRFSTGGDIRNRGSGNAGARNMGRELGAWAFAATLLIDSGKGFLAVALARYFAPGEILALLAAFAVVAGHIWPAQLGFRGGKGVATGIGALAAVDFVLLVPSLLIVAVIAPITKNFTLSGLAAIGAAPVAAAMLHQNSLVIVSVTLLAALIVFAHREDLRALGGAARARAGKSVDASAARRQS
jgi:glycerol-3-phosphate acyltransferase PlsY